MGHDILDISSFFSSGIGDVKCGVIFLTSMHSWGKATHLFLWLWYKMEDYILPLIRCRNAHTRNPYIDDRFFLHIQRPFPLLFVCFLYSYLEHSNGDLVLANEFSTLILQPSVWTLHRLLFSLFAIDWKIGVHSLLANYNKMQFYENLAVLRR